MALVFAIDRDLENLTHNGERLFFSGWRVKCYGKYAFWLIWVLV